MIKHHLTLKYFKRTETRLSSNQQSPRDQLIDLLSTARTSFFHMCLSVFATLFETVRLPTHVAGCKNVLFSYQIGCQNESPDYQAVGLFQPLFAQCLHGGNNR